MRQLALYPKLPAAQISRETGLQRNADCKRCPQHSGASTVCLKPELAKLGTAERALVVVGEAPIKHEDQIGRPFAGAAGRWLRDRLQKHWDGRVVFDYALRCLPSGEVAEEEIAACRPYLANILQSVRPERILAFGQNAMQSLLGRTVDLGSARKGYGWYFDPEAIEDGAHPWVPVFLLSNPSFALRNRFEGYDLEQDLIYALTRKLPVMEMTEQFVSVVETLEDARFALEKLRASGVCSYDTETSGRMHHAGFMVDAVTFWPKKAKTGFLFDAAINDPAIAAVLKEILVDERIQKTGHNVKYDMTACLADQRIAVMPNGILSCTRLSRKILEADVAADLATAAELVGQGGHKQEAADALKLVEADLTALANEGTQAPLKSGKTRPPYVPKALKRAQVHPTHLQLIRDQIITTRGAAYHYLDPMIRARYNARDAASTDALHTETSERIAKIPGHQAVHDEISVPATRALAWIEHWGFAADRDHVAVFSQYVESKITEEQQRLSGFAQINWNSPAQVSKVLFEDLKLPPPAKRTTTGYSTDAEALAPLVGKHPAVNSLLTLKKYVKLQGNYAAGMLPHIREDGRVHPTFLIDGSETGRLSCANPNLQNIPAPANDKEESDHVGKLARDIFYVPAGFKLLEGDMSQQELRVAAFISGDEVLCAEFLDPKVDIHKRTAATVYGVPESQVTEAQRNLSKRVTFGLIYGKTDHGLSKQLGISLAEAGEIRRAVLSRFKRLAAWIQEQIQYVREHGGVWSWWNGHPHARWRPLYGVADQSEKSFGKKFNAENAAVNGPIQGPAADYVTASLWPVVSWILQTGAPCKVVCTVHDSILVEVRNDFVETLARKMAAIMRSHNSLNVPLVPDFKMGERWGSMEKYKLAA